MMKNIREAVAYIQKQCINIPDVGLILGSGLGDYADSFPNPVIIPYAEIPHFPTSTVVGHKGQLVCQQFDRVTVIAMQGRFHYYEGYSMEQVTFPVRVMATLGIRHLILTNAAGGVNLDFCGGDLMLITDHINLMGMNPLRGPHEKSYGERFPDMTTLYHPEDSRVFERVAQQLNIPLKKGVYVAFSGPSYETPAEVRMARIIGGDAVGMSTAPEAIVAHQMGIRVSGVSCITNMAAGIGQGGLNHQEVMATAERVKAQFIALIDGVLREFGALKK